MRVGINGFGRIGRSIFRAAMQAQYRDIEIVHINDLTDTATLAHLLKYDSVHGNFAGEVANHEDCLVVADRKISVSAQRNPAEIPWKEKKVDIVFECTGLFRKREQVEHHFKAGAPKVLVSAPASGEDVTIVCGVNDEALTENARMVSAGSCTTNCLAPVAKVLHDLLTIETGVMTTIHAYTNDQSILDLPHSDLRRARAAAVNMIPTSTGAAKAIGLVLPELRGKIDGLAVRVPTPNVSLVDATFQVAKSTTKEEVNRALEAAANSDAMSRVLGFEPRPLVSSDFNSDTRSSIVDGGMTNVVGGKTVKVLSWYDNETGFSNRMLDICRKMLK